MRCVPIAGERKGNAKALPRRLGLLLGVTLIIVAGLGGSASAALTGLQRVNAYSPVDSSDKSMVVNCPAGKQVTGAGGETVNGAGQVALNDVTPNSALTSVAVQGREDQNGYADTWVVGAHAICATPPPGLERVVATSPFDSLNKTVTATCPASKRLLGAGGDIGGGGGQVVLEDIRITNLTSVTVQSVEDEDGTASDWAARAYAICANPVHLLERIAVTTPTNSADKGATATCPAGKRVVGVGSEIGGGSGQVVIDDLKPDAALNSATVQAFEDEDGTSSNWFARAIAICAAASQRIVARSPNNEAFVKNVIATCPAGQEVTGGGAAINGGTGGFNEVRIHGVSPVGTSTSTTGFSATGAVDESGFAGAWFVDAYAICGTPLPGRELVFAVSSDDSSSPKSVTATCDTGDRVVGAGAAVSSADGGALFQVLLDDVTPNAALTSVTATAYEDETGYTGNWHVFAYAFCATPPPGLERVVATSASDSSDKAVTASCPGGKNLLGTGGDITGGLGQVMLDLLEPSRALTHVGVIGREDETGRAANWSLRSYAICANP